MDSVDIFKPLSTMLNKAVNGSLQHNWDKFQELGSKNSAFGELLFYLVFRNNSVHIEIFLQTSSSPWANYDCIDPKQIDIHYGKSVLLPLYDTFICFWDPLNCIFHCIKILFHMLWVYLIQESWKSPGNFDCQNIGQKSYLTLVLTKSTAKLQTTQTGVSN